MAAPPELPANPYGDPNSDERVKTQVQPMSSADSKFASKVKTDNAAFGSALAKGIGTYIAPPPGQLSAPPTEDDLKTAFTSKLSKQGAAPRDFSNGYGY